MPSQVVVIEVVVSIAALIAICHEIKDLWFGDLSGEIEHFEPLESLIKKN